MVDVKWFGFWESVKLRGWDHASSFTLFSVFFFGSDLGLGEQLWFKGIEVNNRQRQTYWIFFKKKDDEKSAQEQSKLYKQIISRNTSRSQKIKISPLLSLIYRLLI